MYKRHMDYSGLSGTMNWLILILEQIKNDTANAKDNSFPCKKITKLKTPKKPVRPDEHIPDQKHAAVSGER